MKNGVKGNISYKCEGVDLNVYKYKYVWLHQYKLNKEYFSIM